VSIWNRIGVENNAASRNFGGLYPHLTFLGTIVANKSKKLLNKFVVGMKAVWGPFAPVHLPIYVPVL